MAKNNEKKELEKNVNKHEVSIKIDGKDWEDALTKAFSTKQKTAEVPGFRKGKVPRDVYEKHFGKESLYFDAAEALVDTAYEKALNTSKLVPVVQPSVSIKSIDEKGVEYVFTIITKPEVSIEKYKGLGIKKEEAKVSKEEIDHEIHHLLEEYTELVPKKGAIKKGDVAIIDYVGTKDGVEFDGGKAEAYSLEIGSNTFIPGFEDGLIGMKAGEEKDLNLEFPKDYHAKDLAGAKVVFHVKVNEVKEKQERKLDEDFFEDLGVEGVKDEKSLRTKIEENLKSQKDADLENEYVDKLLEAVSKNAKVDIPEEMIEDEVDRQLERINDQMRSQGMSLDLYYQFTKTTPDDLKNQVRPEAEKNVLYRLVLEEIANLEKIEVSKEEAEKEVEGMAKKYNTTKEDLLNQIGGIEMMEYDLEIQKTIDLLKDANK